MKMIDPKVAYHALLARDVRFDGVFYVGVTSTGIYCRPICPVKPPRAKNCRFFPSAAAAEKASFRPCMRCRPELAPGVAPVDSSSRIANEFMQGLEEGVAGEGFNLEAMASRLGLSSRQVRRITLKEFGATPIDIIQTRRLLLAKQLLTETRLSVIDVAFASGFSSLRRFNDAFRTQYRMPPTRLRKITEERANVRMAEPTVTVRLGYRPPYAWDAMLGFLRRRRIDGVESVDAHAYLRTVCHSGRRGWIRVTHDFEECVLKLDVSYALIPCLPGLLVRVRRMFDLSARPDLIAQRLRRDVRLMTSVGANPGLRVPGAFDAFELTWRAILGQQITVAAATTLAGRFANAFGESLANMPEGLKSISPSVDTIAKVDVAEMVSLGIIPSRAAAIRAAARAFQSGALKLDPGVDVQAVLARLVELPGIGPWTAHYIAMRALCWPDAFPPCDVGILRALGGVSPREAERHSDAWRPWRSYAVMHLWNAQPAARVGNANPGRVKTRRIRRKEGGAP
ncbi:MAG: helix-turn-helix domain-containing protein [Opitutaceae bacterium]|nr:helix-turn-helix domain-containing protein [Opitutaceae bacterium]